MEAAVAMVREGREMEAVSKVTVVDTAVARGGLGSLAAQKGRGCAVLEEAGRAAEATVTAPTVQVEVAKAVVATRARAA